MEPILRAKVKIFFQKGKLTKKLLIRSDGHIGFIHIRQKNGVAVITYYKFIMPPVLGLQKSFFSKVDFF